MQSTLVEKVSYLGMPNVRFEAHVDPLLSEKTGKSTYGPNGSDTISFLFSANKNQPLKPAGEVASGGEISRLMLSIKSLVTRVRDKAFNGSKE